MVSWLQIHFCLGSKCTPSLQGEGVKYFLISNPGSKCTPSLNNQEWNSATKHIPLSFLYIIHLKMACGQQSQSDYELVTSQKGTTRVQRPVCLFHKNKWCIFYQTLGKHDLKFFKTVTVKFFKQTPTVSAPDGNSPPCCGARYLRK